MRKSSRAGALHNVAAIREAMLSYYAVNGIFPAGDGPRTINVVVDGETVLSTFMPSGYARWWSPSRLEWYVYSPYDQYGCSYGIYMDTGCVTVTGASAAECTVN